MPFRVRITNRQMATFPPYSAAMELMNEVDHLWRIPAHRWGNVRTKSDWFQMVTLRDENTENQKPFFQDNTVNFGWIAQHVSMDLVEVLQNELGSTQPFHMNFGFCIRIAKCPSLPMGCVRVCLLMPHLICALCNVHEIMPIRRIPYSTDISLYKIKMLVTSQRLMFDIYLFLFIFLLCFSVFLFLPRLLRVFRFPRLCITHVKYFTMGQRNIPSHTSTDKWTTQFTRVRVHTNKHTHTQTDSARCVADVSITSSTSSCH